MLPTTELVQLALEIPLHLTVVETDYFLGAIIRFQLALQGAEQTLLSSVIKPEIVHRASARQDHLELAQEQQQVMLPHLMRTLVLMQADQIHVIHPE